MDQQTARSAAYETVTSGQLTYAQKLRRLAQIAESLIEPPALPPAAERALRDGLICDMHEGAAPYRPRYVLPDYARALRNGSAFLELEPPQDLDEAVAFLQILYHQVPSITTYPVYLGDLDALLEPFVDGVDDDRLHAVITRLWRFLDRTLPDAFTHANIGPRDGRVARMILRVDRELGQVVPNLTLKWDAQHPCDGLLDEAVRSIAAVNKPHIANHAAILPDFPPEDLPDGYGVVSCYNTLPVGGGSHTLVRLNLAQSVAQHEGDADRYLQETLPRHLALLAEVISARTRFLVDQARYFDHGFLVDEGLIDPARFTAMAGIYGMAEAVAGLLGNDAVYGRDQAANDLGHRIAAVAAEVVAATPVPYCYRGRAMLHSQSGISQDIEVTAGARVTTGQEPDTIAHILAVAPHHHLFAAGISDIFAVEPTVKDNPSALADLTRGAFNAGLREITFDVDGCELVRITGYMVRRSDVERSRVDAVRHASTSLGAEAMDNHQVLERASRIVSAESNPFVPAVPR